MTWPSRHRVAAVSGRSPDWMAVFLKLKTAHDRCANASKQANQKQAGHKARLQEIRKEAHDQLQAAEAQLGLAPKPAAAGKRSRSEVEPDGGGAEALQNLDRMSLVLSDDDAPCCLDVDTMGLHGAHDPKLAMPIADLSRHGFVVVKQKQHRLESDRTVVTSVTGLWDGRPAVGRAFVQDWVFLPNIHYAGMLSHANIVTMKNTASWCILTCNKIWPGRSRPIKRSGMQIRFGFSAGASGALNICTSKTCCTGASIRPA